MAISTNGTVLARVAGALYNTQMSNATYSEVAALDPASLMNVLYARDFANASDKTVATTLVTNLGLAEVVGLSNWVAGQLTAAGSAKGAKVVDLLNSFAQMSSDATYGAAATAFNAKVVSALALSQTSGYTGGTFVEQSAGNGGATFSLTTTASETVNGTSASQNFVGLISATSTSTTFNATDVIIDSSTADEDVFTLTTQADITSANTGSVRNVETINVNVNATTLTDTTLDFAATNFTGVTTYNFDVTKAVSAIAGLAATAIANNDIINTSNDFNTLNITVGTAGNGVVVNAAALGSTGSPVAVTIATGTAAGDVTVTGAGDLSLTSTANTGLVQATAEKGLTLSAAAAVVQIAEAKAGNLTVSDASATTVGQYKASGNISVSDLAASTTLTATAGGTVALLSGAGSVATTSATIASAGTSTWDAANSLVTLSVTGNSASATFDLTAGSSGLEDVSVSGSQSIGLKVSAASIDAGNDILNVYDNTTDGTLTVELQTAAGTVDLRGSSLIDRLELDVDNASDALYVRSGQNVVITVDQSTGTSTFTVGSAAAFASNSVTLTLDDEVRNSSAVDLDGETITTAKTVVIDGSVDSTSTGSAVTHIIDAFTASNANSNVTFQMGANNLSLDGAVTAGTGTFTVTGSGTVTDASLTLTASTFDASAATGAVTLDGTALNVATIKTGAGDDTLVLTNNNGGVFQMGAGTDALTIYGDLSDTSVAIDLGAGTDTLKLIASAKLITGTSGTITLDGVENIELANGSGQEIQASLLSGKTYAVSSAATSNTNSVAVIVKSTDTAINLSTLVGSAATSTSVAGMTFVTNASANAAAVTITGMDDAKNTITGSATSDDVLTGGVYADTFVVTGDDKLFSAANVMLDTIAGGASATSTYDQITLGTTGTAVAIVALDAWSKVSGVEQLAVADNSAAISIVLGASAETAGITRVTLAGDSTSDSVANTVSVAAYTTSGVTIVGSANADSIIGGAGADVITAGVGVDTVSGGAGNDSIVVLTTTTLFASNLLVDTSIDGGDGTDTLTVGTNATAFDINASDSWTGVTNVETLKSAANTAAVTLALGNSAYTVGIRTVDISAASRATGNTINVDAVTGSTSAMTLIGSSTGVTTFTGGAGVDSMTGGSANDIFNGKESNDIVILSSGGTDNVILGEGGYDTITGFTAGANTVSGYDTLELDDGTTDLAGAALVTAPGISSDAVAITASKISTFNSIFTGTNLANYTNGSGLIELLTALNGGTAVALTASGAAAKGYLVAYQASNAYVYIYAAGTGDTDIAASEISLIGVINGVAAGGLVADNFA